MKLVAKIFLCLALLNAMAAWLFLLHCKSIAKELIGEKGWGTICTSIETAPELPANFIHTYELVYPGELHRDYKYGFLKGLLSGKNYTPPSMVLSRSQVISISDFRQVGKRFQLGMVLLIEEQFTQMQCFKTYLSSWDFTHGVKGIQQASIYYFNKPLKKLTLDEQLGLILKIDNPYYYDERRHPEAYSNGLVRLKRLYNDNLKKGT